MNWERAFLIGFLVIYYSQYLNPLLILPVSRWGEPRYDVFAWPLDGIVIALLAYWHLHDVPRKSLVYAAILLSVIGTGMWMGFALLEIPSAIIWGGSVADGVAKTIEDIRSTPIFLVLAIWFVPSALVAWYLWQRGMVVGRVDA